MTANARWEENYRTLNFTDKLEGSMTEKLEITQRVKDSYRLQCRQMRDVM